MGLIQYVKEEMQVIMERDAAIKTPMKLNPYLPPEILLKQKKTAPIE